MNEEEKTGKEIARLLNHSLNDISPDILHQLQAVRRAGVGNYQPAGKVLHAESGIPAWSGYRWFSAYSTKLLLSTALLLILVTPTYWESNHDIEDRTDTSTMIFIDDSPSETHDTDDSEEAGEAANSADISDTWENSSADDSRNDENSDNQSGT